MSPWHPALVTFLSLLLWLQHNNAFPPQCQDINNMNHRFIICTSENITTFPTSFPTDSFMITVEFTNVTSIDSTAFVGLLQLNGLHLSSNKITSLPENLFQDLTMLHTLDLTNNLLEALPAKIFKTTPALRILALSENCLAVLEPEWFQELKQVEVLDLSRNKFQKIPPNSFNGLSNLTTLYLSHNQLEELPAELLCNLPKLEKLVLKGNKLHAIADNFFKPVPNLRLLFLQNNNLEKLPTELFHPLPHLDTVDLSHNKLQSIPPGLFEKNLELGHYNTKGLDLSWNMWHCDCHLVYLHEWVTTKTTILYSLEDTVCSTPDKFKAGFHHSASDVATCQITSTDTPDQRYCTWADHWDPAAVVQISGLEILH